MSSAAAAKRKGIDMTEGSPIKSLVLFAIPLVLGDILQQIYNATDSIIVGRFVSKAALAAVGQSNAPLTIFLGFSMGISMGCTVCLSRAFGAKDRERLSDALNTVLRLTVVVSIVITAVSLASVPLMLRLAETTEDAYQDAKDYMTIYFAGISSQILYNMFAGILRSVGDSRRPLIVLFITAVLNVAGDLILVRVFHMGTAGTAIATVAAQAISAIILWFMIKNSDEFDAPIIRRKKMNPIHVRLILQISLPYALQRGILSLSNTTVLAFANKLGSDVMAAWTVHAKLDQVLNSILIDLTSALTTFVSQNVGAGKFDRIKKGTRSMIVLCFTLQTLLSAFLYIFVKPLASLFTTDQNVIEYTRVFFSVILPFFPITTFYNSMSGKLRGLGDSTGSLVCVMFSFVVARQIYLRVLWDSMQSVAFFASAFPLSYVLNCICMITYEKIKSPKLIAKLYAETQMD